MDDGTTRWTIDELTDAVASALASGYAGPSSGRVREVPDERSIRYYTTLGLLDRPAEMRGRTALYGKRHLLQLVAIKKLQGEGLSLAQVQERLSGLPDRALERLASPATDEAAPDARHARRTSSRHPSPSRRADAFWSVEPSDVASSGSGHERSAPHAAHPARDTHVALLPVGVPLDEGAMLLISADRALAVTDVEAIRRAAEPLLLLLERRGLRPTHARKRP